MSRRTVNSLKSALSEITKKCYSAFFALGEPEGFRACTLFSLIVLEDTTSTMICHLGEDLATHKI